MQWPWTKPTPTPPADPSAPTLYDLELSLWKVQNQLDRLLAYQQQVSAALQAAGIPLPPLEIVTTPEPPRRRRQPPRLRTAADVSTPQSRAAAEAARSTAIEPGTSTPPATTTPVPSDATPPA